MNRPHRTLLVVDDSPEDIELYRRYLSRDSEYTYTLVEARLGQEGLKKWQQQQPDAILLDFRLPDLDGLEFLSALHTSSHQSFLPVIIVTGQGNEAIAVQAMKSGAQDYLIKGEITPESLRLAVNTAIETVELRNQLQQRIEREQLITRITRQIHQSLNLEEILNTTVVGVRQALRTDRVLVFKLQSDGHGSVMTESVGAKWRSILAYQIHDPCFAASYIPAYQEGRITAKSNIFDGSLDPCHTEMLSQFQVQANLVVPILQGEKLWGLLIVHHCSAPRQWLPTEIELLEHLADQAGIALQQVEALQQAQVKQAEAEQANRIKDEFLAILSHELRSPLTPILGWAQLLQTQHFNPTKTIEALAIIERNAKLQAQLIDDLLDVSRILRGKLSLNCAPVNLVQVIHESIETVSSTANSKSIEIKTLLPQIGLVKGDSTRLQQVIWNLLSNAIKFTPEGGRVEVKLESCEFSGLGTQDSNLTTQDLQRCAKITVTDTGKGIKPEFLPHLFESFQQEDVSITRQFGGLGLGLAIVRYLVEAHGGSISADSPGEGKGATFTVQLPLLSTVSECKLDLPFQPELDLKGIKVLLLEDEPDTRELFTVLLTEYGADVMTIATATAALPALDSFHPDILISDLGLPDMDGYSLLQNIRVLPPEQGGKIPAIALTAYAREVDRQQVLRAGFQSHIAKPIEPVQLIRAVLHLLQK